METKNKFTLNEVLDTLKEKKIERNDYKLLYENFETKINKYGYLQFRVNEKDKWKNVHTLVSQYFNSEEHDKKYKELVETGVERCLVTHHVNFFEKENKLNNHPDNLQWMGKQEHMNYHTTFNKNSVHLKIFKDKVWNPENPEYNNYEEQRKKIIKSATNSINEHNNVYWNGKENEKNRLVKGELMKLRFLEMWHGDRREELQKMHQQQLLNLWHGDNSDEFREKAIHALSNPITMLKKNKNKVFNIFNNIIENNEQITEESYNKYRYYKNAPYPETVFGSIEIAIEKYQDYPKRIKI